MLSRSIAACALCCAMVPATFALAQDRGGGVAGAGIETLFTQRVASGLARPVYATYAPGDYTRLYIVEQFTGNTGRIRVLNTKTGVLQSAADPFFTISPVDTANEQGLLGLAFDPGFEDNGYFYVNYTDSAGDTRIVRYHAIDKDNADQSSGTLILFIDQPFTNHNGGWMDFNPKINASDPQYLYIGTGDGGASCDPLQRAQDITNQLLGKILRIDVSTGSPVAPADNPFVGISGDDEIWHYGVRNPFRCAFDRETGQLYMADVGQNAREEINVQPAHTHGTEPGDLGYEGGVNYGWDCREGTACSNSVSFQCNGTTNGCSCGGVVSVDPIFEYTHGSGCSIQGGYVYRGCRIPTLDGTYFYADHCSNQIWSLFYDGTSVSNQTNRTSELAPGGGLSITSISSFGEDALGEMYICDTFGGEVFKILPRIPTISEADVDCSGAVNTVDLLALLAAWGPCDGCIFDLDGDGEVSTVDLLLLLGEWG